MKSQLAHKLLEERCKQYWRFCKDKEDIFRYYDLDSGMGHFFVRGKEVTKEDWIREFKEPENEFERDSWIQWVKDYIC